MSVHPSRLPGLRDLVVPSGIAGAARHGYGLTGADAVDGYFGAGALDAARMSLRVRDSALVDHAADDGVVDGRVVTCIEALLDALGSAMPS